MNKKIKSFDDISNGKSAINFISGLFEEVYLVGGAVRDEILNRPTFDLDFAVPNAFMEVRKILENEGLKVRTEAERFGTISTKIGHYEVQITTYRSEAYSLGDRHPLVTNITDIDSDLARRDFSINAIAVSKDSCVDPYNGQEDICKKVIKTVGDPCARFIEDPLRILRAYRFVSQLGFDIDTRTLKAIEENARQIKTVSPARIGAELNKIISGDYWMDAIYEAISSGVIGYCLGIADFGYDIPINIASGKLDLLSQSDLIKFTINERWILFFEIIIDSESGITGSSTNPESTIRSIGQTFEMGKKLIDEIVDSFEKSQDARAREHVIDRDERVKQLSDEYELLHNLKDDRQYIVLSKLQLETGKEFLDKMQYRAAKASFLDSIKSTDKNFQIATEHVDDYQKAFRANKIKYYFIDRYIFYLASYILDQKLNTKETSTSSLIGQIKEHAQLSGIVFQLGRQDTEKCISEAIVLTYKILGRDLMIGTLERFLDRKSITLSNDRLLYLKTRNYFRIIHSDSLSNIEKSNYYLKIANLMKDNAHDDISLKFEYYDPLIDSLVWKCRSAKNLNDFWEYYSELQKVTDEYIDMAHSNGGLGQAYRSAYLNSASALTYALTIAENISEKIEISQSIVIDYKMAGYGYEKNAKRFNIYFEWFSFVESLNKIKSIEESAVLINGMKSLDYIDPDEIFFVSKLSDLAKTRDNIKNLHSLFNFLINYMNAEEKQKFKIGQPDLDAILTLFVNNLISVLDVFAIIKNFCLINSSVTSFGLSADIDDRHEHKDENISLIENGENDMVEFKSSWRYNKLLKQIDPKDSIATGIIRTISAFMNTSGGKLFIGINDNAEVSGLESADFLIFNDEKTKLKKIDRIKLQIDELISTTIGSDKSTLLSVISEHIDDLTILIISVNKSLMPVFYGDDFYIRASASTRRLTTSSMINYINEHFGQSSNTQQPT